MEVSIKDSIEEGQILAVGGKGGKCGDTNINNIYSGSGGDGSVTIKNIL